MIGGALLTAAVVLALAPAAFSTAGGTSLTGEALALRTTDAYAGCTAGAASYSCPLTGTATGPVAGTFTATVTSTVAQGTRTTTIAFDDRRRCGHRHPDPGPLRPTRAAPAHRWPTG